MSRVFVSYSDHDRDLAAKLVDRLRKAVPEGVEIVFDDAIDARTDATATDAYRLPFVGKRLRGANTVVAVLTRSYAESDPCWLEMSAALMMEKVVPINLDPGLSPAGLRSMVSEKTIIAVAPNWFGREPGEVERAETAKFDTFVADMVAASRRHKAFTEWAPAEPKDVRMMTVALAAALRPRLIDRTGLVWSPGSLAEVQKRRFFAAIDSMSIATGDGAWDVARRKALKAMADEPASARARAEALMGLVGELTAPSDGSPPVTELEPWEFVGDIALPIDRDISRFAYTRAGKIPNELRKMFQVLRPGKSKRPAIFALGALLGGVAGVTLAWGGQLLFGHSDVKLAQLPPPAGNPPEPRQAAIEPAPSFEPPAVTQPAPAPARASTPAPEQLIQLSPPKTLSSPPAPHPQASTPAPTTAAPAQAAFAIGARGLEASVKAELARRNQDSSSWKAVYGQVISLNMNTLCSPDRWKAAEDAGKKPLDLIRADTQLTWPTDTDLLKQPRLLECPLYRIPT